MGPSPRTPRPCSLAMHVGAKMGHKDGTSRNRAMRHSPPHLPPPPRRLSSALHGSPRYVRPPSLVHRAHADGTARPRNTHQMCPGRREQRGTRCGTFAPCLHSPTLVRSASRIRGADNVRTRSLRHRRSAVLLVCWRHRRRVKHAVLFVGKDAFHRREVRIACAARTSSTRLTLSA